MHPETLEQLLFLQKNRSLWNEATVAGILHQPRTPKKRRLRESMSPDM
ncbi:hypothetical protein L917_10775 [Phytophthora nicotianae]|uniref:Uncharacterized protein n=1 Tax=Phytophthora nicotianae TaxID=4792 RepID=W2HQV2_PHYNI|nr:hypothetical protein L916_21623 [Phytophthora nicotianae]ETL90579.1 hypothetical protein L917_10775 [Phytophthora nicotianae]ETM30826.1 hypothetical protein L914_21499 [Phytophthora nicotianae]